MSKSDQKSDLPCHCHLLLFFYDTYNKTKIPRYTIKLKYLGRYLYKFPCQESIIEN